METVTSKDKTLIAFDRIGQGPPLVLVWGAFSYRRFPGAVELAKLLSERFSVFNYDRRGRGDSSDSLHYAVEREVEDLDALIDVAGGSAHVFGLSSGAALAVTAAAHGSRISKLALYEPPYMVGAEGHRPSPGHEARLRELLAANRRGAAVSFFLTDVMGAPWFLPLIMRVTPFWPRLKAVAHTLPYDTAILGKDFALPGERIAGLRMPTLIAAGEKSPAVLRAAAAAVKETLPGAQHLLLKGQSHNVSMKALAPVLLQFFGSQP